MAKCAVRIDASKPTNLYSRGFENLVEERMEMLPVMLAVGNSAVCYYWPVAARLGSFLKTALKVGHF